MTREEVYALINGEREYQERTGEERGWGGGEGASNHSVGDFLVMLDVYCQRAKDAWASNTGDEAALDMVRKVAGISVACMEKHGAPARA